MVALPSPVELIQIKRRYTSGMRGMPRFEKGRFRLYLAEVMT